MPNDSSNVNLNVKAVSQNTYDAIVVGSGISGGWAAKELCEAGLKTLVLERGRNVEHIKDYTGTERRPGNCRTVGVIRMKTSTIAPYKVAAMLIMRCRSTFL